MSRHTSVADGPASCTRLGVGVVVGPTRGGPPDVHATIYKALGIPADTSYISEGRPVYVTKDGKGKPIDALLV